MRLLDRYVLKQFLTPFLYCFLGFLAIWFIFDLNDNGSDFLAAKASIWSVGYFYVTQLPQIVMLCLPVGLLLALLFALSKMSRSNEVISMLTAGISVTRIILPLFVVGLICTGVSMWLNYKLAPHSEALKKQLLDSVLKKGRSSGITAQLFRNRVDYRTWYVRNVSLKRNELQYVHILQQDAHSHIRAKYFARRASYDPTTKIWTFSGGKVTNFDENGVIVNEELWLDDRRTFAGWSETPWRIASTSLDPKMLSVPELREYLKWNADYPESLLAPHRTHLHFRYALPWACFVVVFIAAPLGIVYSRRGVLAGVASSIFIFFGHICLKELFLAFGESGTISPVLAAWGPNLFFLSIGLYLLYLRANNRELPRFGDMLRFRF